MSTTPMVSLAKVAQIISERHSITSADVYADLREMIVSGVIQQEGITVYEVETKMGKYGLQHFFSDCDKTVAAWETLHLTPETKPDALLNKVVETVRSNTKLQVYFPHSLIKEIEQYLKSK